MRYKNQYILLVFLSFCTFNVKAQNLDSLLKELNNHKNADTSKLNLFNSIAKEYQYINIPKGLQTADSAIALAQRLNDQAGLAEAYRIKGLNYFRQDSYTLASDLYKQSYKLVEQSADKKGMANCLNDMGNISIRLADYNKAKEYFESSLSINQKIDNQGGIANNFLSLGNLHKSLAEFNQAIELYNKAESIYKRLGNTRGLATIFSNMGDLSLLQDDHPLALTFCYRALNINSSLKDSSGMINSLNTMGNLNYILTNYDKALELYKTALNIHRQIGKRDATTSLDGIARVYERTSRNDEALQYFLRVILLKEELGVDKDLAGCYNNLGFLYYRLSDYLKAWNCYKKALSFAEQLGDKLKTALVRLSIGELYLDAPDSILVQIGVDPKERYTRTLEYLNRGKLDAIEVGYLDYQRYAWQDLSIMYERQKDYSNALESYKKYISLRDKIINNEKDKKISRIIIQNEFDRKADSINLLNKLTDQKLKQQLLIAKQQQQQLILNKTALDLSNKEKDLQKLAYLKTQADLQNEQLEKKDKEKQLTLSEKEKQLQQEKVKTLMQENKVAALKQRQQWIYIIGGAILLSLFSFYFIYRTRLHEGHLKNELAVERLEQQQKEAEFQRQLGDISLSALRSQMNPHFIFNCLNSIKLYTTQNDTAAASEYLTKFSRLIRLVLENSRNDRISLAAEFDALRLYMEMEAMRFKEKMKYTISVDKDVDLEYIEIPPLLLQPYVENAIWHGLMQKEEGGRIDVTANMQHNESALVINITDNGIGRAKSEELMSKTATKHKSYGMKVTSERLTLIKQVYKTGANVTIHDLTDDSGQPSGTRVTIKIPID